MSTNLQVSITDGSSGDIITPNTGFFTSMNLEYASVVGGGVLIVLVVAISVLFGAKRRSKSHVSMDGKRKLNFKNTIGGGLLFAFIGLLIGIVGNINSINTTSTTSAIVPAEALTVTAEDINLELVLGEGDPTAYKATASKVTVSNPNESGYTLKAYTSGADLVLNESDEGHPNKISMVGGNNVALADNTWGIALVNPVDQSSLVWRNLSAIESEAITLKTTSSASDSTETIIYYGAYVTDDLPHGVYTGVTINYIATSNPVIVDNIEDLTYMQDFATLTGAEKADVLASMTMGDQYTLKDNRDDKTYYISKLKDGNVWMTQNLDLDLDSNAIYTSSDTDIDTDWTPDSSTYAKNDITWKYTSKPESYNPGAICWDGVLNTYWIGTLDDSVIDCDDSGANTHYRVGNYYNWAAAVAMNNTSTTAGVDVDRSICPAGWTLPKSGDYVDSGSFVYLNDQQGLTSGASGNIQNAPTYFVYSGRWYGSSGYVGSGGYYWSSVADSSSTAYAFYLSFNVSGSLNPQNTSDRRYGCSVRCLAR